MVEPDPTDSSPTGDPLPDPRRIWLIPLGIAAVIFVSGLFTILWFLNRGAKQASALLPPINSVAEFQLIERSGRTVTLEDLKEKVWIAGFIFTRCVDACPAITGDMAVLRKKLPPEVRLVSFTVDPDHDTPKVLTEYAERFGADKGKWWFLTGDRNTIYTLLVGSFKLPTFQFEEGGETTISHSAKLALVDRKGFIRGYFDTEEPEDLKRIARDALLLSKR